jgi:histidine triad (HIT) family protein
VGAPRKPAPARGGSAPAPGSQRCKFCAIAHAELLAHVVLEDDVSLAFLDHRPLFPGHALLVPRAHYETLADLPASLVSRLFGNAQRLARAVERAFAADGSFVAVNNRVSQSVAHLHVHVVPRRFGDGLRGFFWPRQRYPHDAAMRQAQTALRQALAQDEEEISDQPGPERSA